jgi:hypothetical protein
VPISPGAMLSTHPILLLEAHHSFSLYVRFLVSPISDAPSFVSCHQNGVVSPLAAVKTDSSGSKTTSGGLKSLRRSSTISAHTAVSNADDAHYSSPNMVAGGRRGSILTPILTKQKSSRRASLTTLTLAGTPSPQQASAGGGGGHKKGDLRHKWLNNSALHDSAGELSEGPFRLLFLLLAKVHSP